MCYLRGLLMLKLNRADQAKTCFMEALALDVKCADAFSQLVNAEMLTPDEGTMLGLFKVQTTALIFLFRMGVHPGSIVLDTNTRRRRVCATNIHLTPKKG